MRLAVALVASFASAETKARCEERTGAERLGWGGAPSLGLAWVFLGELLHLPCKEHLYALYPGLHEKRTWP